MIDKENTSVQNSDEYFVRKPKQLLCLTIIIMRGIIIWGSMPPFIIIMIMGIMLPMPPAPPPCCIMLIINIMPMGPSSFMPPLISRGSIIPIPPGAPPAPPPAPMKAVDEGEDEQHFRY